MKHILPIVLLVSIGAFVALTISIPGYAENIVKKKKQLDVIAQEEKNLPALASLLETQQDKITLLEKTFPTREELVLVVQSIDTIAFRSQVAALLHFESEQPSLDDNKNAMLPVTLTIEGEYLNVIAFLDGIAKNKYLVVFQAIEATTPTGIRGVHKVVVRGNLYVANN